MKKIIYLFGIVALFAACNGNRGTKESTPQDDVEMRDDYDGMEQTTPVDTTMQAPADTAMRTPPTP